MEFPSNPFKNPTFGTEPTSRPTGCAAAATVAWAFGLVVFTLAGAVAGVTSVGLHLLDQTLTAGQCVALGGLVVFFVVVEGWLGFHKSWSPVTARRCFLSGYAAQQPCTPGSVAVVCLAPLYATGFFYARRRRLVVSYALAGFIVGCILAVGRAPSPWHEIIDCAVAAGIGVGTLSFIFHFGKCLATGELPPDVDAARELRQGVDERNLLSVNDEARESFDV